MVYLVADERAKAIMKGHYKKMSAKGASKGGRARMAKHYPDSPNKDVSSAEHSRQVLGSASRLMPRVVGSAPNRVGVFKHSLSDYYKYDAYSTL